MIRQEQCPYCHEWSSWDNYEHMQQHIKNDDSLIQENIKAVQPKGEHMALSIAKQKRSAGKPFTGSFVYPQQFLNSAKIKKVYRNTL